MERKTKYQIGFWIILIAALGAIAAFYLLNREQKTQDEAVPTPILNSSATNSPSATITVVKGEKLKDWHTYDNSDYGFRINFSEIWKGYEVKTTPAPKDKVDAKIEFSLKTSDPKYVASGGRVAPLVIYVYKDQFWNDETKALFPQTEVAKCKGFTFAYSTWEESPQDLQGLTDKEIADTLKALETSCK